MNDDAPEVEAFERDLQGHRARCAAYYRRATYKQGRFLEGLFLCRLGLEMHVHWLPNETDIAKRRAKEVKIHNLETAFCIWCDRIRAAPLFLSLTPAEREAIDKDCFHVDFEHDPMERIP